MVNASSNTQANKKGRSFIQYLISRNETFDQMQLRFC